MSSSDQQTGDVNQSASGTGGQPPPPSATPPPSSPPPAPSQSVAVWLVITFLNIALFVFVVPDSIFENKKLALLTKVFPAVVAGGLFAAGLVWFKNVLMTLPDRRWFKTINIIFLSLLIPLNVSQQNVVAVHPQIETNGYKFKVLVDNEERAYEPQGNMRLSIANHTVRIVPETEEKESNGREDSFPPIKEGKFRVSYKDMFHALFADYRPRWGPLYIVLISIPEPNVEVSIRKKDGDFDLAFVADPPPTGVGNPFTGKAGSRNEFVYRGSDKSGGTVDRFYLPYGDYEFTASRAGCNNKQKLQHKIGEDTRAYIISLDPLCPPSH